MKQTIITAILLTLINTYSSIFPERTELLSKGSKEWETESNRLEGNFILDIIQKENKGSEPDTAVFVATGAGFSYGYNTTEPPEDLKWRNSTVGYGGSSAIAIDKFDNIWMTTAADSFIEDIGFLATGTGVHMSSDLGKTWTHFPQPGITSVQGLAYDIACDSLGGVWMACWGQSLQKTEDMGQTWKTLTCDKKIWDPFNNDNQKMFSVHSSVDNKLWVGTADGINFCDDISVADSLKVWTQYTVSDGLSGNWVTDICSYENTENNKTYIFISSWATDNPEGQEYGVSYTDNNGMTWNKTLLGRQVYCLAYNDNDVFACAGESGLWKSSDNGNYWEKYQIRAWSDIKKGYVDIGQVYSFLYQNDIMFVGTGQGMVVSGDDGNTWYMIEAYESSSDSANDTYAYPNPFSPQKFGEVKLQFKLAEGSQVTCEVFNFAMEKVRTVTSSAYFPSGEHYLVWDGKDSYGKTAANGVYFYIISYGDDKVWNKIIIFE